MIACAQLIVVLDYFRFCNDPHLDAVPDMSFEQAHMHALTHARTLMNAHALAHTYMCFEPW